ncbi:MAG: 3-hydroxyacyl-CoA dehydrogenase family protein, partial [Nevskiales bacterium]
DAAARPENVIGLHYFSPVEKMPLLEIITTDKTAPEVTSACVAFGKAQGKTVIVVKDGPGFYTTRVLAPYLNEAARILGEGVPVRDVDQALLKFGFPVGPISLMDEVGIDVGLKVGPILEASFGERFALPEASKQMQDKNWLGRKTGRGFYVYEGQKKKGPRPVNEELYNLMGVQPDNKMAATEIAERCVYMFANEAAHCLGDGILQQPMHGDIGAVFGLGFLPFTGGPFRYIDQVGVKEFVAKLEAFQAKYGDRFAPAPILLEMAKAKAKSKQRFYP